MVVRCWIASWHDLGCQVAFEIDKLPQRKRSCDGYCDYALVDLKSGRATQIPDEVRQKYSI
jgi:thioesterase III